MEISGARQFIDENDVKYRAAVGESVWTKFGAMMNFLGRKTHEVKRFQLDGPYGIIADPQLGVDGVCVFEFNAEIFNVWIYNMVAGSSGTTELDLKLRPRTSGTFTSIFATTPKIGFQAGNEVWLGVGNTQAFCTAPILTPNPVLVNAGDGLRLDKLSSQVGGQNCGLIVHYRNR